MTPNRFRRLLSVIVGLPLGIFLAEVIAMVAVYSLNGAYWLTILVDALITTALMIPLLYLLSYRPLLHNLAERERTQAVLQFRLRLLQFVESHSLDELLPLTLDEMEDLTESEIGFFHFLESDQVTLSHQAWSTNTVQVVCNAEGGHNNLDEAGVWAECVRKGQPVVHNDYASLSNRLGTPEGHAPIRRELTVPIVRQGAVVAVFGMGNKPSEYTQDDVALVKDLAGFAWDIIERKRAADALAENEEKFRTLVEWAYSWESWVNPQGEFVYISPSCERISGYRPGEFVTDPTLLSKIIHPDDRDVYEQHRQLVHDGSAGVSNLEFRIVGRDGNERWIEHICRPLYGEGGIYLGRRVSNWDVTQQRLAERAVVERNRNEAMLTETLHNLRLDIARDLHDTLGQNIGYLRMKLDHLSESDLRERSDLEAELAGMLKVADKTYDLVRGTLDVLQADGFFNPVPLFRQYAAQVEERAPFSIELASHGDPEPIQPGDIRQMFFVFREALSNIEKHAGARNVQVDLTFADHHFGLAVADDGHGFDQKDVPIDSHYGLRFMRERIESIHGDFNVRSEVGEGTRIEISVPFSTSSRSASMDFADLGLAR
jgi:PAS domain S-box-containing protein